MPRKNKSKKQQPSTPSPVKQLQQQAEEDKSTPARDGTGAAAAPAAVAASFEPDRNSPVHALAALIDEHNASHSGKEQLQLFVATTTASTPPGSGNKNNKVTMTPPISPKPGPSAEQPGSKRVLLRSAASAPEELSSYLHHAESDDSLFSKSITSLQQSQYNKQQQQQTDAASGEDPQQKQTLVLAPMNSLFDRDKKNAKQQQQGNKKNSTPDIKNKKKVTRKQQEQNQDTQEEEEDDDDEEAEDDAEQQNTNSSGVRGSFVPILTFTKSEQVAHPEGTASASRWNQLMRLLGGLVLVSRVNWSAVLLYVASYCYVPLIAAMCVTTANALLAVASIAILPVIEYSSEEDFLSLDDAAAPAAEDVTTAASNVMTSVLYSFFHFTQTGEISAAAGAHHQNNNAASAAVAAASLSSTAGAVLNVLLTAALSLLILLGTAVSGYKLSSMVGDAFLDSCRIVVDQRSGFTLLFFSLYGDLVKIFSLGSKYVAVFVACLLSMPAYVVYSIASGGWCSAVARRPAFVAAFAALMLEVAWLIFQIVRFLLRLTKAQRSNHNHSNSSSSGFLASPVVASPRGSNQHHARRFSSPLLATKNTTTASMSDAEDVQRFGEMLKRTSAQSAGNTPSSSSSSSAPTVVLPPTSRSTDLAAQLGVWWARKIPKMRKRGFFLLFLTAVAVTIGSGLLNGMIAMVEGFLYVSTLHLAAHVAARATLFIRAVRVSLRTIAKDTAALVATLIVGPIFLAVAIANFVRFGMLGFIQVPVLVLALCSIASHADDLASSKRSKNHLLSSVSIILSRVSLMNPRRSYDYGAHWKMARYVRILLRVVIAAFTLAVVVASTYTAVQAIHFRFSNYQSSLLQVTPLEPGDGGEEAGLRVFTDSFSLYLRKASTSCENINISNMVKKKKSRLYRGMCQRRWFAMSGNGDDADEVDKRLLLEKKKKKKNNKKTKTDNDEELHFGDMAIFSMLSYVAPMNEQRSLQLLLSWYRRHRSGAEGWSFVNPISEVWDPLRAELMRETAALRRKKAAAAAAGDDEGEDAPREANHDDDGDREATFLSAAEIAEARELIRWSQHHVAQSLRPPFFHFKRKRGGADDDDDASAAPTETTSFQDNLFVMRGTELALASDIFQNMIIFSDVFLIEQLAHLVPGVGLLPLEFIRDLVTATNFVARVPDAFFWHAHMRRYMRACQLLSSVRIRQRQAELSKKNNDVVVVLPRDNFACVGHSLGGVACQLAAPPLRIPAVALSAPGALFLSHKFGVTAEATEAFTTNLVVSNDIIPLIGSLSGEVHNVNCEHDAALLCHSVQLSLWRFLTHCESLRQVFSEDLEVSYQVHVNELSLWLQRANKWVESILGVKLEFQKF